MKQALSHALYLDFDGVLHPQSVYMNHKRQVFLKGEGTLFAWCSVLESHLDAYPDLPIVLSTSWVEAKGFGHALKRLPKSLAARVVGATWHSHLKQDLEFKAWWEQSSRFEQIERDVRIRRVERWVSIDDEVETWPESHAHHLIACHHDEGLGRALTQMDLREKLQGLMSDEPSWNNRVMNRKLHP